MMNKFLKPVLFALSLALFSAGTTSAAELGKVSVVDMKKLFDEYYKTKTAQEKVKKDQAVVAAENAKRVKTIQEIADEIKKLDAQIKDAAVAPQKKEQLKQDVKLKVNQGNAAEQRRREWLANQNQMINESIVAEMKKILAQIQDRVEQYARDNDIDMIFDSSARGTTQTHFLLFSVDKLDITSELLADLNKGVKPLGTDTGENK